jgi:hypothetical protein
VVAVLVLAAAPVALRAQVNIESMRQQRGQDGFSVRGSLDLSTESGNVDKTDLGINTDARYRRALKNVLLAFQGDYGWQGGEQFSDQGLLHLRYTHGLNRVFALEAFVQTDYNKARLLDARALAGGGVRVSLVESERAGVAVGASYMFEHEELDLPPGADHPEETDVDRLSSYVGLRWTINDNAALSVTGYVQPQVDEFDDVRVIASGAVETRVVDHVSLRLGYRLRHDSRPPDTVESTDTKLSAGLGIAF